MSSGPLISHHLFVAAVKQKRRNARLHGRPDAAMPGPQSRQVTVELVDFGRPMALETAPRLNLFGRIPSS